MSSISGLRTVVRLKKRRIEQFEAALAECREALAQQHAAREEVRTNEAKVRAVEHQHTERYLAMVGDQNASFNAESLVVMQLVREECATRTAAAVRETQQADEQVAGAEQAVEGAQRDTKRAEQQHERIADRLKEALQARDREQEEAQDEEAEETAVARMVSRAAQAKRLATQGSAPEARARSKASHG